MFRGAAVAAELMNGVDARTLVNWAAEFEWQQQSAAWEALQRVHAGSREPSAASVRQHSVRQPDVCRRQDRRRPLLRRRVRCYSAVPRKRPHHTTARRQ